MLKTFAAVLIVMTLVAPALAADVTGEACIAGRRGSARDVVVYLEGAGRAAPLPRAVVDQRGQTFIPHVSVVTVGTTVEFPNNDTIFHNVFAYFHAKRFDLGMYPRGTTKRQTFDKKGVVALLCNVHAQMSAYIMVVDTPWYAVTDQTGRFHIPNVQPGRYTLHAWHESGTEATQSIVVQASDVNLKLALDRPGRK